MNRISLNNKTILVTGAAGFIGSNLVKRLLKDLTGATIVGIDNMNNYYDVSLKEYRLQEIERQRDSVKSQRPKECLSPSTFDLRQVDRPSTFDREDALDLRPSTLDQTPYKGVEHLVYASSSSVYGGNKKVPFSTDDRVDNPVSLYAATKKSNELFAHCYSKLYNIPTTGLRFFTVYGPAGRPDMAYFGFTNKLLKGETIQIFNYGNCRRDFTYVDDIVEGIVRVMQGAPERKTGEDGLPIPPYAVYNIGGGQPENLLDFVQILQEELLRAGVLPEDYDFEAHKELVAMQPGDVPTTYADATALERDFGFTPKITLREGLRHFAEWYKKYYF